MAKLTLTDIASTQASSLVSTINANNALIEAALENTLSRDGTSPNTMEATLDMNSERIINLPEPASATEPLRKGEFDAVVDNLDASVAAAVAAQVLAEGYLDEFTDLYLGSKVSDPAVDNDGDALQEGAIYFNNTTDNFKVWKSGAWVQPIGADLVDSAEIDVTYAGLTASMSLVAGSIDETKLDASVNASLDLADSASQPGHTHTSAAITDFTEAAQDATGAMVDASLTYVDGTPLLQRAALTGAITASAGSNTTALGSFTHAELNTAVSDADLLSTAAAAAAYQPLDADLTSIAALSTTAYGRAFLTLADEAAFKASVNLEIGTDVQAYDADLTTWAGLTPSANAQSLVTAADYAAMRAQLDLEIGTDVQAYDADLTTWAGLTPSANAQSLVTAANYAAMRTLLDLEAGTDFYSIAAADAAFQPLDADLTSIAALTTTAAGRSALTITDPGVDRILAWDDSAGTVSPIALADLTDEPLPADGDFMLVYGAEGDLRKVDWADLPGAAGGIGNIVEDATPQLGGALDTNGFGIEFGTGATDTTMVRASAGDVSIEGNIVYRAGGTDVAIADGGTGQSTATAAFDALAPTTTQGDIIYHNGTDNVRLGAGTSGQFLKTNGAGANPAWADAGITAATQAEQEAASSTTVATTPGRQHFHPSAIKCWGNTTGAGTPSLDASYNMTSITDDGTGRIIFTIATDFSSSSWAVANGGHANAGAPSAGTAAIQWVWAQAAGSVSIASADLSATPVIEDPATGYHMAGLGDL